MPSRPGDHSSAAGASAPPGLATKDPSQHRPEGVRGEARRQTSYPLVFATFISLVLVPSGYMIAEDLKSAGRRLVSASEEPAGQAAGETTP